MQKGPLRPNNSAGRKWLGVPRWVDKRMFSTLKKTSGWWLPGPQLQEAESRPGSLPGSRKCQSKGIWEFSWLQAITGNLAQLFLASDLTETKAILVLTWAGSVRWFPVSWTKVRPNPVPRPQQGWIHVQLILTSYPIHCEWGTLPHPTCCHLPCKRILADLSQQRFEGCPWDLPWDVSV